MTYSVIYVHDGDRHVVVRNSLDEAVAEYEDLRRIDKLGAFDDRFVSHIEDQLGRRIHP